MIALYHPEQSSLYQTLLEQAGLGRVGDVRDAIAAGRGQQVTALLGWQAPQTIIDACPRLEWIQNLGAGVDWVLSLSLHPRVRITRVIDQFGADMAEYALLAALAWVKDFRRWQAAQRAHRWDPFRVGSLAEQTVGVLGAGSIGQEVALRFVPLAHRVRALGRSQPGIPGVDGYAWAERGAFLRGLNVLVVVVPLTPQTRHLVDKEMLAQLAPASLLVNIARGGVVDSRAVQNALFSGQLSLAVLDVFETEPLPPDDPLWDTPGLVITPHGAGPSRPARVVRLVAENVRRFAAGEPLLGAVDRARGY
ncbi:MAG: NAD(P)-dependent oxidoreductase [Thermaerobacter sp.]|nr:NAD(P)-dependent oxidoreductase [Thermaerobacter sp.]